MDKKTEELLAEMEKNTQQISEHIEKGQQATKEIIESNLEAVKKTDAEIREAVEEHKEKAEEIVKEVNEIAEEVKEELAHESDIQLTLDADENTEKVRKAFRKKYGYDSADGKEEKIELVLESNENYIKAHEEAKQLKEKLDQTKMDVTNDVKEKADKVAQEMKQTANKIGDELREKASDASDAFRESSLGKSVLGDDGKFDKEDLKRLANDAVDASSEAINKLKNLFKK